MNRDDPALRENLTNKREGKVMRRVQVHGDCVVPLRPEHRHTVRNRPDDKPKLLQQRVSAGLS